MTRFYFIFTFFIALNISAENWPQFRGPDGLGIAENYPVPASWTKKNVKWKIPIPGLAHSCPVIWNNLLFLTTAVNKEGESELDLSSPGGKKPVVDNNSVHQWKLLCLDKRTGTLLWDKTAHEGIPKAGRHAKSTHANSTPVTDGRHVIAFFASQGLFCYDMNGVLKWKKDLGILDSGYFRAPKIQWGFASSPVIHGSNVIIQCDIKKNPFLALFDIKTGREIWRIKRDEVQTWSTPTVYRSSTRDAMILVNGYKHIGGYDFRTGQEIWRMKGGGDIPVPTPVVSNDLIFICSAHGKMSPIYAVKLNARGDISLTEKKRSNRFITWSIRRGGAYMQTPLIYRDLLYNLQGNGNLSCFQAKTGKLEYKEKLGKGDRFSASGIAADGKLYFASENGNVYVVRAGTKFKLLSINPLNDKCMATPALSNGTLFFRTHHFLIAISKK